MKYEFWGVVILILVLSISLTFNIKHYLIRVDPITLSTPPPLQTRIEGYEADYRIDCEERFPEDNETLQECYDAGKRVMINYFGDDYHG